MTKLNPRLEKMLKAQSIASIIVGLLSLYFSISFCVDHLGWNIGSMMLASFMSWVFMKIGILICTIFFQTYYYGGDYALLLQDAMEAEEYFEDKLGKIRKAVVPKVGQAYNIIKTHERIGTFQDVPFYDAIEILGRDGNIYLYNYFGTDASKIKRKVPEDCILIEPGILYQVVLPINKVA